MGKFEDLAGQVFGELTVISRAPDYILPCGKPQVMWNCKCSCGKDFVTRALQLKNGESRSCGHLQKEIVSKLMKERKLYNTYDLSGEYGIGYDNNGKEFYFDLEDHKIITNYYWMVNSDGYVEANVTNEDNKRIKLHRLIMNVVDEDWKRVQVDHVHGKESRNDNRKSNLRIVTRSQNNMNIGLRSNNTSGVTGVDFVKKKNKWRARITVNKNKINLGEFEYFNDAVNARKAAEKQYFKEYSYDYSQQTNIKMEV